jgi:mannose-1-phosphate guanylyltransferase/mannose-6-phosphate isomerase
MLPIILCGGSGSRLWPLSRSHYPKQFLKILGQHSLLQETILRLPRGDSFLSQKAYVISNQEHRFLVAEQLREIQVDYRLILEPVGRNTAAAIAVASLQAAKNNPQEILLVLSADHAIHDKAAFADAIRLANQTAQAGAIVTFGITPTAPEIGYGYIEVIPGSDSATRVVKSFVEKPDLVKAKAYLKAGNYYWNSGMFAFRADVMLAELQRLAPDILSACEQALKDAKHEQDFVWLEETSFGACRSDSIDYAVMEKTQLAQVVPFAGGWNDVGSWSAVWDESPKDDRGNVLTGDVVTHEVSQSYIHAESRLVGVVDVDNLVVVETSDAVLITQKGSAQKVKDLVELLKHRQRQEGQHHQLVHRPWGSYESFSQGPNYQVKRLIVKPGARISVQYHHHRSEHWVVISGIARVRVGEQYFTLSENQSTFIPVGVVHSLENPSDKNLEVIEVQSGSYLGEDDIVRIHDNYGRN